METDGINPDFAFLQWLSDQGYRDLRLLPNGRYACTSKLLFTFAIITGRIGDCINTEDRWCFSTYARTKAALDAWDGNGEPTGWHRHPNTGRRRADGDPARETVAF